MKGAELNYAIKTWLLLTVVIGAAMIIWLVTLTPETSSNNVDLPRINVMEGQQHETPVYLGNDEGRLDRASDGQDDAVLIACKRDPNQVTVISRGYNRENDWVYQVADNTRGDGCERNNTNRNLEYHWLYQGGLESRVSYHTE